MIDEGSKEEILSIIDNILEYIFSDETLMKLVAFKGGTALVKVYNINRFSKDIDLSYMGKGYGNVINNIRPFIIALGLNIINISQNSIEFKVGKFKCGIDVSYLRDVIRNDLDFIEIKDKKHRYFVRVLGLDEIMAEKIRAIMERREAKDLWDVYKILEKGTKCSLDQIKFKCEHSSPGFLFDCNNFINTINSWTEHRYISQLKDYVDDKEITKLIKVKRKIINFMESICNV